MDSKMFLTIFIAVWTAGIACYVTRALFRLVLDILDTRAKAKLEMARQTTKKANSTGRIIGFRPIENERV